MEGWRRVADRRPVGQRFGQGGGADGRAVAAGADRSCVLVRTGDAAGRFWAADLAAVARVVRLGRPLSTQGGEE